MDASQMVFITNGKKSDQLVLQRKGSNSNLASGEKKSTSKKPSKARKFRKLYFQHCPKTDSLGFTGHIRLLILYESYMMMS